jgi:Putative Flp pilus-assembly TadE/G-like
MFFNRANHSFFRRLSTQLSLFSADQSGAISYLTAMLVVVMVGLTALAADYGMAVVQKGRLDAAAQAAALSGANAARNLLQLNMTQNPNFDNVALQEGETVAQNAFDGQFGASDRINLASKFVVVARVGNTLSAQVDYTSYYLPIFANMFGVNELKLTGRGSIIMGMVDNPPSSALIEEVWERPTAPRISKTITDPDYRDWKIQGGNIKIDPTGDPRAGDFGMLIGSGNNNSIAKKIYMPAGAYELRYWYESAVIYPEYQPAYICDPRPEQVNWATSHKFREWSSSTIVTGSPFSATVSVYLHPVKDDPQLAIAPPPNGTFTNMIDMCVYSGCWIERSLRLEVKNSGYFWLAFVGEAPGTSYKKGGWIGKVKLCIAACSDPPVNNFPYQTEDVIFQDSFNMAIRGNPAYLPLTSGEFPATSKYEAVPSTQWTTERPNAMQLSNQAPLYESGNHVRVIEDGQIHRRLLLPPGRYALRYVARSNSPALTGNVTRSKLTPFVGIERAPIFGSSVIGSGGLTSADWRSYSYCITVSSSGFFYPGFRVFMGQSELRMDSFKMVAGYPGYVWQFSPTPNFCSGILMATMLGLDQTDGSISIDLDRVTVTPPTWQ